MLHLLCPHGILIFVPIEDGKSNLTLRREFAVGSDCIACKASREAVKAQDEYDNLTKRFCYPASAEVIRERRRMANPSGVQQLRNSFKGTFRALCEATDEEIEQNSCKAIVNLSFDEDMIEIERAISISKMDKKKTFELVLSQQQQNSYCPIVSPISDCEMDLEMECCPEKPQLFRPWM